MAKKVTKKVTKKRVKEKTLNTDRLTSSHLLITQSLH